MVEMRGWLGSLASEKCLVVLEEFVDVFSGAAVEDATDYLTVALNVSVHTFEECYKYVVVFPHVLKEADKHL